MKPKHITNCNICGKFVSMGGAGVSSSQTWSYGMDGMGELNDLTYRCSKCTDKEGLPYTNCNNPTHYQWRNPLNAR